VEEQIDGRRFTPIAREIARAEPAQTRRLLRVTELAADPCPVDEQPHAVAGLTRRDADAIGRTLTLDLGRPLAAAVTEATRSAQRADLGARRALLAHPLQRDSRSGVLRAGL